MHTQRRYATCPQGMSKKREKKYSPYQKIYMYKGEGIHIKEFHPPSTKNIQTLSHLDQGLWLVSPLDPVFDSAKYEKQVCHHILHTYRFTKKKPLEVGWKRKAHKKALVRNKTHLSDPRDHPRNLQNFFSKTLQNLRIDGQTKEWVNGTLQDVLTLNRQRWGWCYKPHRSKVKRCERGQLIQNKGENTRLCLLHKSGMRHCSNSWSTT